MKIGFRTDSSKLIGAGHLRRCLKLADDLKYKTKDIIFITRNLKGNFNKLINKKKFKLALIKNNKFTNDLNETKKICKKFKINYLIIDNYKIGSNWEKKIRSSVEKLIVIDDFTKKKHYCDLIFNNLKNKTSKKTKNFTGLEYVIIPNNIYKKNTKREKNSNLTVGTFFGTNDSKNCSEKFLSIFSKKEFKKFKFIAVLGNNNSKKNEIERTYNKHKNINIEKQFIDMKNFLKKIDILITSGGVTSYEALCNNIECINVPINYYQKTNSFFQRKKKISRILNYNEIQNKKGLKVLVNLLRKSNNKSNYDESKLFIDTKASQRISEILIPSSFNEVSIKRAKNFTDCVDLFKLCNEKSVIKNSFNQKEIKFNDHVKWFKRKIKSGKTYIYIFSIKNLFIGQVRFDFLKKDLGLIDYSLEKNFRGRGWGKLMLAKAINVINKNKKIKTLKAEVKKTNLQSIKVFDSLFFSKDNNRNKIIFYKKIKIN
jgi:UDP-2,4-diacetamido-2,4,6-trideoxy-beta-L-altropyranose hydrolase